MGIRSWWRDLTSGRTATVDYATLSDDRLRELWEERASLTEASLGRLEAELGKRGLAVGATREQPAPPEPPPPSQQPRARKLPDGLQDRFPAKGPIQSAKTSRDVIVQGVPCRAATMVGFGRTGRLINATLAADWSCDGVSLPAGAMVGFHGDGRLQTWYATLREPRTICGLELPAGTEVSVVDDKLETLRLAAPLVVAGHAFPAGTNLGFSDDGVLSTATCDAAIELAGIPCAAYETVRLYPDGTLHEAYLAGDHEVQGVPCQAHEIVRFFEGGKLARCYVSRDFERDGVTCAEATRIYFDESGRLLEATPARDLTLDGVPCPAGKELLLREGRLVVAFPARDFELGAIPCGAGRIELVDGALARAKLSRAHAFGAHRVPADAEVVLDREGRLRMIWSAGPFELAGQRHDEPTVLELAPDGAIIRAIPAMAGFAVSMHPSYRVSVLVLGRELELEGIPCRAQSNLECHDDGRLLQVVLARDTVVAGLPCRGDTQLRFHPDGKPAKLTLARDARVGGIPCLGATTTTTFMNDIAIYGEYVSFHETGTLAWAKLSEPFEIQGVTLARGESIVLHPDGTLHVGTLARDGDVGDKRLRAGTLVSFHPSGTLALGTLAKDWSPPGSAQAIAAGTAVTWDADGTVLRSEPASWPLETAPL